MSEEISPTKCRRIAQEDMSLPVPETIVDDVKKTPVAPSDENDVITDVETTDQSKNSEY